MKAKFFFLGLCALALAACSIDEVSQINDTNAVTFKATTITRADVTTTNNLQEFSVWAWNGDNEFMDDVIATRNGTSSTFTTSPLYFWPTGSVDFYALAPATGVTAIENDVEYAFLGGEINEGDDVNPSWTYEGYVAKAKIANGEIVIDACIPSLPEDQIDLCYGVALGKSSGSVTMNFRHALSQIAFKAKSANTAFDVKIADVSVCSVYKEGVYTIGKNDTSTHLDEGTSTSPAAGTQGEWAITEEDTDGYAIKGRFLVDMTDSVVDVPTNGDVVELVDPNGTLMLLPQTIVAWDPLTDYSDTELGSYLRILCHVEESGSQLWPNNAAEAEEEALEGTGAFWKDAEGVEYAEIAIPLTNVEWEQGYRYTYTIIFGEGLGYYPPDDPNYDLEGKPVLDIITFDVTVDEFQDADGVDVPTDTDLSEITVTTAEELVGAARMGYEVIDVEDDITLEGVYVEFTHDCVLNLADGVTITATNSTGTDYPSINGYNGYTAAICVTSGTLTINGEGSVVTTGGSEAKGTEGIWVNGGEVIINGGTYKGGSWNIDDEGSESAVFVEYGAAYIYGGTFYSGKWKESGNLYYVLNCMDTPRKNGQAWIYVYGGTYYLFDPSNCNSEGAGTNFVVDGYSAVADGDYYNVVLTTVATPADLAAALAAGASEITVSESFSIEQGGGDHANHHFDITSKCTITLEDGVVLSLDSMTSVDNYTFFWLGEGADLTIEGNGTLMSQGADGDKGAMCFWVSEGANLTINGGTYYSGAWAEEEVDDSGHCVYVYEGTATINAGTFVGTQKIYKTDSNGDRTGEYYATNFLLNCRDSNYKDGLANIYVYGGKYCNFDPHDNAAEGSGTNFCVEGYTTTSEEGTLALSDGSALDVTWYTVVEGN